MTACINERESVPIWSEKHYWATIKLDEARNHYQGLDSGNGFLGVEDSLKNIGDGVALGIGQVG